MIRFDFRGSLAMRCVSDFMVQGAFILSFSGELALVKADIVHLKKTLKDYRGRSLRVPVMRPEIVMQVSISLIFHLNRRCFERPELKPSACDPVDACRLTYMAENINKDFRNDAQRASMLLRCR